MTEKQQQLLFDKGITNVPSDALCSDNALEESLGMVYDNGEHRVIQSPVIQMTTWDNYTNVTMLYIHKFNNKKRYIYLNSTRGSNPVLSWGVKSDDVPAKLILGNTLSEVAENDPEKLNVTSIGKTLIVADGGKIHYYLWKGDVYKYLGDKIPAQKVRFWISATGDQYVKNSGSYEGIIDTDEGHVAYGKMEDFNNLLIGLYSKNKKSVDNRKGFCRPFLIRTALRLYDGTYTNISQPMMLFPSVRQNSAIEQPINNQARMLYLYTYYQKLKYQNESFLPYDQGGNSFYENWTDIVKDIAVFITDGVEIYDVSVDQGFRYFNDGVPSRVDIDRVCVDPVTGSTKYTIEQVRGYSALVPLPEEDIESELVSRSVFYKLCTIGLFEKYDDSIEYKLEKHTLEHLTTQEQLGSDDYFSHCNLSPQSTFSYNSRLNIASVKRSIFEGFDDFYPILGYGAGIGGDYTGNCRFYVTIETDDGERVAFHEAYTLKVQGLYFYYPDSRAKYVMIFRQYGLYGPYHCLTSDDMSADAPGKFPLTEHECLNGAYYYRGLPAANNNHQEYYNPNIEEPKDYDTSPEPLANYIIQSEVNNPFVFKAAGYFKVGTGKIMSMSTITQALSEGQYGQFPLLVFSESGIWALSVSSTGYYDSIHPMSREVCNNIKSITQTDGAVFFSSEKGLMVIVGSQVKCVSEQLSGRSNSFAIGGKEEVINLGSFHDYLKDGFIAYDYRDSLLWIFNANYLYCWVYSIKSGTFGKYDYTCSYVVNDYPDYITSVGSIFGSFLDRPNINDDTETYDGIMISRPMKLENATALKSIMRINHIHTLSYGSEMTLRIFASNNLIDWAELNSLRGMPWLYYRFRYDFANMKATDRFSGSIVTTQERRTDKPRTYINRNNEYKYHVVSNNPDVTIPENQQEITVRVIATFKRNKRTEQELETINSYWAIWSVSRNGRYTLLHSGYGEETEENVTANSDMSAIVIGMNVNGIPSPASTQATKSITVTKIPDTPTEYIYSIDTNISSIVIPYGSTSVERQVSAYAMRTADGVTEGFACYIKMWKLTDEEYTKITGVETPAYGCGAIDVFESTDTSVVIAISNEQIDDTYGEGTYLCTPVSIPITVAPDPTPTSDFDSLLGEFNDVLNDSGLNSVTEEGTPNLYSYLQTAYDMAVDEWEDPDSELFDEDTYPELYTGTDYRGTNTDYNETARESLLSWLMAMLLEEIVPSSAAQGEVTNTQTEFFKLAYNRVDPNGDGKNIPLYGGFEIHSDPMIARLAAGGVYAKVRSSKTFAEIEEMRKEFYGDSNDHWIPASDWSGLGYTHTEVKNGNDERIGYNMDSLGYLVNTSLFLPSSPGPRVAGCFVDNEPLPSTQGQNPSLFISDDNYDVDDKINDFMVDNYRMMAQTPLSVWNGYSAEIKKRLVQVMATARCTYMFMFGSPIDVSLVLDDGELPVVDGYNRYVFEESAIETGLRIDGPFSDLAGIYRYNIPNENKTLQELFLETVAEIANDGRYPTFDPNFGRRRPGCGDTISGTEANPIHGSAENELYNVSIACMVADNASQKTSWAAEDGFAADRPNSYPSGHTAQVWTHAMMLGQMDPSRLTVWMRRAYEFSVNRSIGRAHWNSDLMYGRLFATMVVPLINAMNGVQAGYNAVKETVLGGGGVTNPVISINIAIVNNSGSAVTLDGDLKFTLGNPDHNGNYLGWNGPYNGTPHLRFSPDVVTLEAGETRTFYGITWRDEDTGCGLGEKSPANAEQLAASERPRNVLFYVGGNSEVVMANNMDPAIIFKDGQTYTVTLG